MDKKNLFSIGAVAKAVGITRKTILNYETKGLIAPDKKDSATANRYYTIDTFTKVRTIRTLQNLGLTLDEIHQYYNDTTDLHPMITRLKKMRDELNLTIERLEERTSEQGETIKEITIEHQIVYNRNYNCTSVAKKTILLRNTALEAMREYGTDTTKHMYFTEYSLNAPEAVSFCIAVPNTSKGEHVKQIPTLRAISLFHHGAYEDIPTVTKNLLSYAEENGIKLSGRIRSLFLEGPPQHNDKTKFITQVMAIIEDDT